MLAEFLYLVRNTVFSVVKQRERGIALVAKV
jgi:hypothetical protein